jgi:hypothetical protein
LQLGQKFSFNDLNGLPRSVILPLSYTADEVVYWPEAFADCELGLADEGGADPEGVMG